MRITLLTCVMLTAMASATAAQTVTGPWEPRVTIGAAIGTMSANRSGDWDRVISGTAEIPFTDKIRIRIEGGRGSFPVVFLVNSALRTESARVTRLTAGAAMLTWPGAPVSPYFGGGAGVYHTSVENGPTSETTAGANFYAGAEVLASDRITIDGEIGGHLLHETAFTRRTFGEVMVRVKVGL